MWWYLGIAFGVYLVLWVAGGLLHKMVEREKKDPEYSRKMDKHRAKWIPKFDFVQNLFTWILVLAVIYFIFLGGSL